MKALLIVDVQNDFCPGGALAVPNGNTVVSVINKIMKLFPLIVASKDWHPKDSAHFQKWPVHCVKETKGAEFHPQLNAKKVNEIFLKGTENKDDGYSAFEATNKNLNEFLKQKGVTDLYVTGLATDYCVKASALDAVKNGFKVYLVEDAVKGVEVNPGDTEKAKNEMKESYVTFVSSESIE